MKILVTGGAGYIGSHAVKILLKHGCEVVVIDNLSTGHIEAIDNRAIFYKGSIGDYDFVTEVLKKEKIDGVLHFAAFSLVFESMQNPHKYYANNVCCTNTFIKALVDSNIKYIVFSSTAAVYGDPTRTPIIETDNANPTNVYGETKLTIERMLKWYSSIYGIKYVCLRYFNVAGSLGDGSIGEAHNPESHLIPIVLQVASGKRDILSVYGNDYETKDGTCIRDYIHIVDLCEAHYNALEYLFKEKENNIFNLGSSTGYSVLDIVKSAEEVTKKKIPLRFDSRRAGDPTILIASSDKAKSILKWQPKYDNVLKMIEDAWTFEIKRGY